MVIRNYGRPGWRRGALTTDLVAALGIFVIAVLPLAFAFEQEMRTCRGHYHTAVAMEIVDGEMEILAAGEWRAFQPGAQPYAVRSTAATNLPPGRFTLTMGDKKVRLEWKAAKKGTGRRVVREASIP